MAKAEIFSLADQPVDARNRALQSLRQGELILLPTETVYGLGADSAIPAAVERLSAVKGRLREKPFQWLIATASFARENSTGWDPRAEKLAGAFWPGPLTLVVPNDGEFIGWRVPRHDWLLDLLVELGRPLIASSANASGQPPYAVFEPAYREFATIVDIAVDGGKLPVAVASTVVILEPGGIRITREGAIPAGEIQRALR